MQVRGFTMMILMHHEKTLNWPWFPVLWVQVLTLFIQERLPLPPSLQDYVVRAHQASIISSIPLLSDPSSDNS